MEDDSDSSEAAAFPVADFATYYLRRTRVSACALLLFAGLNVVLSPVYRVLLLDLPALGGSRMPLIEWGLIFPVCVIGIALRWRLSRPALAEAVTLAAVFLVSAGIAALEYFWTAAGRSFPALANALFLVAAVATTGVDYRRLFAVAAPVMLLQVGLAYVQYGFSPAAHLVALYTLPAMAVVLVTGWQVQRAMWQSWDEGRYFQQLSERDPMTGLLNRRAFEERARQVLRRAVREHRSVVLAVLDFDHFARFNEACGRATGDRALRVFGRLAGRFVRQPLDLLARLGDEEFVLLWFDVAEQWGRKRAETLVRAVREMDVGTHRPLPSMLSASVGAVCAHSSEKLELSELLREVDGNLLAAKRRGGDNALLTASGEAHAHPDAPPVAANRA